MLGIGGGGEDEVFDADAIHNNVSGEINSITEKVSPAALDEFIIEDSAAGYAKKKILRSSLQEGTSANERPKRIFFGNLMNYPNKGSISGSGIVQYTQVFINMGVVITNIELFVDSSAAGNVRLGIYNQADVTDFNGIPNTKLRETAVRSLTGADNGKFVSVLLLSNLSITTTGYYWLAMIGTASPVKYAVTDVFRANYLPRREQASSGTNLPATAGSLTNPLGGVIYVAGIRQ